MLITFGVNKQSDEVKKGRYRGERIHVRHGRLYNAVLEKRGSKKQKQQHQIGYAMGNALKFKELH